MRKFDHRKCVGGKTLKPKNIMKGELVNFFLSNFKFPKLSDKNQIKFEGKLKYGFSTLKP